VGPRQRKVDGHGGFAHPTLAGGHRDDVAHAGQRGQLTLDGMRNDLRGEFHGYTRGAAMRRDMGLKATCKLFLIPTYRETQRHPNVSNVTFQVGGFHRLGLP
jgi:hypothetical protein